MLNVYQYHDACHKDDDRESQTNPLRSEEFVFGPEPVQHIQHHWSLRIAAPDEGGVAQQMQAHIAPGEASATLPHSEQSTNEIHLAQFGREARSASCRPQLQLPSGVPLKRFFRPAQQSM
jgi:hypothetical protein